MARESKPQSKPQRKQPSTRSRAGLLAGLSGWLTVLILAGACSAGYVFYPRLLAEASTLRREAVTVTISWPPLAGSAGPVGEAATWLPEKNQQALLAIAEQAISEDPFDHESLERCAAALTRTGWLKGVRLIRREQAGVVRIVPDWRTPAAVVRHGEADHLVSADGDLLPMSYPLGQSGLRVILNPKYPPPGLPGERWLGGDVQAALALIALLQPHKAWPQVAAIDAENYEKAGRRSCRLSIISDRGNRVVWGGAPGETRAGEPPVKLKLAWLEQLLTDPAFGRRIDAGMPLVDLTNPRGVLIDATAIPLTVPTMSPPPDAEDPATGSGPNETLASGPALPEE